MISARALVRNMAATEQDWNASINSRPGTEYMCVNHVRHIKPHFSESSGAHHLHKVKCYNFSEPMEEASKVVYTAQLPNIPAVRGGPKPPIVSSDKSTKKSKDRK